MGVTLKSKPLISLGLDTGYATLGWGVLKGEDELLDCGTIETNSKDPPGQRLQEIETDLIWLIDTFQPDRVGIEKPYFGRQITSQAKVLVAMGVMLLVCQRRGIEPVLYHQASIKAQIAHGGADKYEVAEVIYSMFGIDGKLKDDTTDAVAIAYATAIDLEPKVKL